MTILSLNHYTVRTADWERSRRFYEEVVGLTAGERPPFDFPGHWLYAADGNPVLHLVGDRQAGGTGGAAIDHIAFLCRDFDEVADRLRRLAVPFEQRLVPRDGMRQIFLHDPDGVRLELNFPAV